MKDKKTQNSTSFKARLLSLIEEASARGEKRLMPEAELAKKYGVSRQLVRDSLSSLEQEGYVLRVHGVGTIINRHVAVAEHRIDLETDFIRSFKRTGKEVQTGSLKVRKIPADAKLARELNVPEGTDIAEASRIVTLDGVPAVFCIDHFPAPEGVPLSRLRSGLKQSTLDYLRKAGGIELQMDIAELKAVKCSKALAEIFLLTEDDVVLAVSETGYDLFGEPRFYSLVYYKPGVLKHTVVRKKIG